MPFFGSNSDLDAIKRAQDMVTPQRPVQMMGPQRRLRLVNGAVVDDQGAPVEGDVSEDQIKALLGMGPRQTQAPMQLTANPLPGQAFTPPKQLIQEPTPFNVIQSPERQGKAGQVYSELPSGGYVAGGPDQRERFMAQSGNAADTLALMKNLARSQALIAGGPIPDSAYANAAMMMKEAATAAHQAGQTRGLDNQARIAQYDKTVRGPEEDLNKLQQTAMQGQAQRDVAGIGRLAARDATVAKFAEVPGITAGQLEAKLDLYNAATDKNIQNKVGGAPAAPDAPGAPPGKIRMEKGLPIVVKGPDEVPGPGKQGGAPGGGKKPPTERMLSAEEKRSAADAAAILTKPDSPFSADDVAQTLALNPNILLDPTIRGSLLGWLKTGSKGGTPQQRKIDLEKALIRRAQVGMATGSGKPEVSRFGDVEVGYDPDFGEPGYKTEIPQYQWRITGPGGKNLANYTGSQWLLSQNAAGLRNAMPTLFDSSKQKQQAEASALAQLLQHLQGGQ